MGLHSPGDIVVLGSYAHMLGLPLRPLHWEGTQWREKTDILFCHFRGMKWARKTYQVNLSPNLHIIAALSAGNTWVECAPASEGVG
jgi:hypothetical protein